MTTFQEDEDTKQAANRAREDSDPEEWRRAWQNILVITDRLVNETEGILARTDRLHGAVSAEPDKQAEIAAIRAAFITSMQSKLV